MTSVYDKDVYLRALAVQATPCFGYHDPQASICERCPLAASCVVALEARLAEWAEELHAESLRAAQTAAGQTKLREEQEQSVDELLALENSHPTPKNHTVARDSVCTVCGKKLHKGIQANWAPGKGVWCLECDPKGTL